MPCLSLMLRGLLMGELIIVTGPPGAGKSAVSGLVADSFDSSILIPADWFFGLWRRGDRPVASASAAANQRRRRCRRCGDGRICPCGLPGCLRRFYRASALAGVRCGGWALSTSLRRASSAGDDLRGPGDITHRARVHQRGCHALHAPRLHTGRIGCQASHHGGRGHAGRRL